MLGLSFLNYAAKKCQVAKCRSVLRLKILKHRLHVSIFRLVHLHEFLVLDIIVVLACSSSDFFLLFVILFDSPSWIMWFFRLCVPSILYFCIFFTAC